MKQRIYFSVFCPSAGRPVGQKTGEPGLCDRVCRRRLSAGSQDLWQVRRWLQPVFYLQSVLSLNSQNLVPLQRHVWFSAQCRSFKKVFRIRCRAEPVGGVFVSLLCYNKGGNFDPGAKCWLCLILFCCLLFRFMKIYEQIYRFLYFLNQKWASIQLLYGFTMSFNCYLVT